jgi:histone H2B
MPPKCKILLPKPSQRITPRPPPPPPTNNQEDNVASSSRMIVVRRMSSPINPVVSTTNPSTTNPKNGSTKNNQSNKATNKKPSKHSSKISFSTYTKRVNKSINPNLSISQESLSILDSYVWDMFYRLVEASQNLVYATGKKTLTERDIEFAVKLVLPGSLKKYAIGYAKKSMQLFKNGGEPRNADNSA